MIQPRRDQTCQSKTRRAIHFAVYTLLLFTTFAPAHVLACGSQTKCKIGNRHYLIRMPDVHDGTTTIPALIYAHGYTGTANAVMRSKWLKATQNKLGVALIAAKSYGKGWSLPGSPSRHRGQRSVDETAYFDRLLEDVTRRFPIDRKRIVATGFSSGAMMVWTLACQRSRQYAGFIPIAGTFWRPMPQACPTPAASLIHLHGDNDPIVPLSGRVIGAARQGDVRKAIDMYTRHGGFGPARQRVFGHLTCSERRSSSGNVLKFCLYPGGHTYSTTDLAAAWRMLQASGAL